MKKLLFILFCCIWHFAFSQNQVYAKKFPGNVNAVYLTNSTYADDLAFVYETAKDTNNAVYLIENFKPADIKVFEERIMFYDLKLWRENYTTKKGDFIFSFTSATEFMYFYHLTDKISSTEKSN